MKRSYVVLLCAGAIIAGGAVWSWLAYRRPPGLWRKSDSIEKIRVAWAKEEEWSRQSFTPIRDNEDFAAKLRGVTTRIEVPLSPKRLEALWRILHDQLVCRHSGSLDCYRKRFAANRRNPLDDEARQWVEVKYRSRFDRELAAGWAPEPVFEEMWHAEYGENGGEHFDAVALGPMGAVVAVGEVRSALPIPPEFFFTEEEVERWVSWPGAIRRLSAQLHPGRQSLSSIIADQGDCTYANVALLVQSANGEVWCWGTYWYLDPKEDRWELHGSVLTTRRPRYFCPM